MKPFRLLAAATLTALCAAGAALAFHTSTAPTTHLLKTPLARTWPNDKTFQWQLDNASFPAHTVLCALLRSRQSSTDPQQTAIVSEEYLSPTLPNVHEIRGSGLVFNDNRTLPVLVTAQLVALNDLALPNLPTPLRCLVTLDANGTTWIRGEDAIIQGDFISGWAPIENPQWKNNELHLLTFFTHDSTGTYTHNLLLQRKQLPP